MYDSECPTYLVMVGYALFENSTVKCFIHLNAMAEEKKYTCGEPRDFRLPSILTIPPELTPEANPLTSRTIQSFFYHSNNFLQRWLLFKNG